MAVRNARTRSSSRRGPTALDTNYIILRRDMALKLSTPDKFTAFPFFPYEIQLQLMRHLYEAIEDEKVTIVESPTGTVRLSLWVFCISKRYWRRERPSVYCVPP